MWQGSWAGGGRRGESHKWLEEGRLHYCKAAAICWPRKHSSHLLSLPFSLRASWVVLKYSPSGNRTIWHSSSTQSEKAVREKTLPFWTLYKSKQSTWFPVLTPGVRVRGLSSQCLCLHVTQNSWSVCSASQPVYSLCRSSILLFYDDVLSGGHICSERPREM